MRRRMHRSIKVYGVFSWPNAVNSTEASATARFSQSIWSFHLAGCSNLRQACGDLYEQFQIQEATVGTSEVQLMSLVVAGDISLVNDFYK